MRTYDGVAAPPNGTGQPRKAAGFSRGRGNRPLPTRAYETWGHPWTADMVPGATRLAGCDPAFAGERGV